MEPSPASHTRRSDTQFGKVARSCSAASLRTARLSYTVDCSPVQLHYSEDAVAEPHAVGRDGTARAARLGSAAALSCPPPRKCSRSVLSSPSPHFFLPSAAGQPSVCCTQPAHKLCQQTVSQPRMKRKIEPSVQMLLTEPCCSVVETIVRVSPSPPCGPVDMGT